MSPHTSTGSLVRRDGVALKIKSCTAQIRDRDGNIMLMYQPKIALNSGEISGVEALIRWQHLSVA